MIGFAPPLMGGMWCGFWLGVVVSVDGTFAPTETPTYFIPNEGSVVTWGSGPYGGGSQTVATALSSDVVKIYNTERAFAALKSDGSLAVWGNAEYGGDPSTVQAALASGVVSVTTNLKAFCAVKSDGSAVTWGFDFNSTENEYGTNVTSVSSVLSTGVQSVTANGKAFAAQLSSGEVITWGKPVFGGDSATVQDALRAAQIRTIYTSRSAFAAVAHNGSVISWGDRNRGGSMKTVAQALSANVTRVYSTLYAFLAVKGNSQAVSWGDYNQGGNSFTVRFALNSASIVDAFPSHYAMSALRSDGQLVVWGYNSRGGNITTVSSLLQSGVKTVARTRRAFAALKTSSKVVVWGETGYGGNWTTVKSALSSGVDRIYANAYAFAAVKNDGSVVAWGDNTYGGNITTVSSVLSSGVQWVVPGMNSFSAVTTDGSVVAWGNRYVSVRTVAQETRRFVKNITANSYAYAAIMSTETNAPVTVAPTQSPLTGAPTTHSPSSISPATGSPTSTPTTRSPTMVAPTATSAILSDAVTSIRVYFSRALDPGVPVACASLLTSSSLASLGNYPVCVRADASSLDISLGQGFTVTPGTDIVFAGDVLFGPGESYFTPSHAVVLSPPASPPAVAVAVLAPSVVGVCAPLVEAVASATGGAGKSLNFTWEFYGSAPAEPAGFASAMRAFLQRESGSRVSFQSVNFTLGSQYWFNVTGTNWLGMSSSAGFSLSRVGQARPLLVLPSSTTLTVRRSEPLEIRVQVRAPQCPGLQVSNIVTRALWSQTLGPTVLIPDPSSVYLYIPPNALDADTEYAFEIYAWTVDLGGQLVGNASQTFAATVQNQPVVATIAGGAARSVSIANRGEWLRFDSSGSRDPMYPTHQLNYTWSLAPPVPLDNTSTAEVNGSSLHLSPSLLGANRTYIVLVRVLGAKNRSSEAVQTVVTSAAPVPDVTVSASYGGEKHNPGDTLVLTARVSSANATVAALRWTTESDNFNMSDRSLLLSGTTGHNLVIAPGSLMPGLAYRFRVTAATVLGGSGHATSSVIVNSPPSLGACVANPQSGIALVTTFRLSCAGWTDSDVPLQYKFQSAGTNLDICDFRQIEFYDTQLPAGSAQLCAVIADSVGAATRFLFNAMVAQPALLDLSVVERERSERLAEGDTQAFGVLVAGTAAYLKTASEVNASAAGRARGELLDSIRTLNNASLQSSVVGVVASLVESATDFRDPAEMAAGENRDRAIQLLQTVSESSGPLSEDAIIASTTAMSNIISAAASVNGSSSVNASTSIEAVLVGLSDKLLEGSVEGQDPKTTRARQDAQQQRVEIEITGQRSASSSMGGSLLQSPSTGTEVVFPPLPNGFAATPTVALSFVAIQGSSLYPSSARPASVGGASGKTRVQGGLVSIQVRNSTGEILSVQTNETHPFRFTIPGGNTSRGQEDAKEMSIVAADCEYWSVSNLSWRRDGVRAFAVRTDGSVSCNSTHLTAFSSNTEFRVRVNTISAEDLSASAFDPSSNPMSALLLGLLAVFAMLYPVAWRHDRRMKRLDKDGMIEISFWRTMNRVHQERIESRAAHRYLGIARWALRRRHPWTSIFYRPNGDYLTSQKRLMILLVLLLNMACVCALLIGNTQQLPLLRGVVANALVSCAFAFPVPHLLSKLFARRTPARFRIRRSSGALSGTTIGYVMLLVGVCVGLDAVDEAGEDHEDGEHEEAEDEKEGLVDEDGGAGPNRRGDEEEPGAPRQVRAGGDEDRKQRQDCSEAKHVDMAAAGGVVVGTAAAGRRRAGEPRRRGPAHGALLRDMEMSRVDESKRAGSDSKEPRRRSSVYTSHYALSQAVLAANKESGQAVVGLRSDGLRTHEWSRKDVVGVAVLAITVLGCTFVLGALSWTHKQSASTAVLTTLVSYAQDILARVLLILLTEYLLMAPLCLCCCACCYALNPPVSGGAQSASSVGSHYHRVVLHSDQKAFNFDERGKVTAVHRQARVRGVQVGWRVVAINGCSVLNGRECRRELSRAHRMRDTFEAVLTNDSARRGAPAPTASPPAASTDEKKSRQRSADSLSRGLASSRAISSNSVAL